VNGVLRIVFLTFAKNMRGSRAICGKLAKYMWFHTHIFRVYGRFRRIYVLGRPAQGGVIIQMRFGPTLGHLVLLSVDMS